MSNTSIKITIQPGGPARIETDLAEITLSDGSKITKHKTVFLCRCAESKHQPFCDGLHKQCKFEE